MDVGSKKGYPSSALSNFAPHPFAMDGVAVNSMEGWLQSLKFDNPEMQKHICALVGLAAKRAGRHKNWQRNRKLYWMGAEYDRESDGYQELLDRAYDCLFRDSSSFRRALVATGDATLEHSIGRTDPKETVLTRREFCRRLEELRVRAKRREEHRE